MKVEDQFFQIKDEYTAIDTKQIQAPRTSPRKVHLLKHDATNTYYLGYEERTKHLRIIELDEYLKVKPAEEYTGKNKNDCCYCNQYKTYQIIGDPPALDACKRCHKSIKKHFDQLVADIDIPELTSQTI